MALSEQEELELLLLLEAEESTPEQPDPKPSLGQVAKEAIIQSSPITGAIEGVSDLPPTARRAALTTAGAAAGSTAGVAGAGLGGAIGGQIADLTERPESIVAGLKKATGITSTAIFSPGELVPKLTEAFGVIDQNVVKDQAIKGGIDFAFGLMSGVAGVASSVKATGPFTAAFKNPKLLFEKSRQAIFTKLNRLKGKLKVTQDPKYNELLKQASVKGKREDLVVDLASRVVKNGVKKTSSAELVIGREAAGKVAASGGELGKRGFRLKKILSRELNRRAKGYTKALDDVADIFAFKAQAPVSLPGLAGSLAKAQQAASSPLIRQGIGATSRAVLSVGGAVSPAIGSLLADGLEKLKNIGRR